MITSRLHQYLQLFSFLQLPLLSSLQPLRPGPRHLCHQLLVLLELFLELLHLLTGVDRTADLPHPQCSSSTLLAELPVQELDLLPEICDKFNKRRSNTDSVLHRETNSELHSTEH